MLPLLLGACANYRSFEVQVMAPATVTLDGAKRCGFMDRNIRVAQDTSFVLYRYEGIRPDELSDLFHQGLSQVWTEEGIHDSIIPLMGEVPVYLPEYGVPAPCSPEAIREICQTFGLDYVVSLEAFYYTVNNRSGSVANDYCLRLYAANTATSVDSVVFRNNLSDFFNEEEDFVESIRANAWKNGMLYGYRLVPHWETAVRRVYNRQKVLRVGDAFYREGKEEQALHFWDAATKSKKLRIAVDACLNLAWLSESKGDFAAAIEWLRKGEEATAGKALFGEEMEYLKDYRETLRKRIADNELIRKQEKP